jgi:O-antigen/teichoic acid export membrane protein
MLYGLADVIVLAVGGFVLLPLYTRMLSQTEFGVYVIFRANTELITYLLFFGLPSAVGRLYFEYKKTDQHIVYMSSVVMFFLFILGAAGLGSYFWGAQLWTLLSPGTPVEPYLGFSLALAVVGFYSAIGTTWLRMEGRVKPFVALQVVASLILAVTAVFNLVQFEMGLLGLLWALLISGGCTTLVLPWLFGKKFRPVIRWEHITDSLHFAVPIVIGYFAYFVLNRISTVILQRHITVDQVAVFGLAQQLAMIVTIAATGFGKALQPMVFAADAAKAADVMVRTGNIFRLLMFCITAAITLFASEIFALMAPKSYGFGYEILLILLIANFAYSFSLVSNTALLYHRRPKTSVVVSIFGAVLSASLGSWLIPTYQLYGAALAILGSFIMMTVLSHWMAYRITGHSYFAPMLLALAGICVLSFFATWLQRQDLSMPMSVGVKLALCALIFPLVYFHHIRRRRTHSCTL